MAGSVEPLSTITTDVGARPRVASSDARVLSSSGPLSAGGDDDGDIARRGGPHDDDRARYQAPLAFDFGDDVSGKEVRACRGQQRLPDVVVLETGQGGEKRGQVHRCRGDDIHFVEGKKLEQRGAAWGSGERGIPADRIDQPAVGRFEKQLGIESRERLWPAPTVGRLDQHVRIKRARLREAAGGLCEERQRTGRENRSGHRHDYEIAIRGVLVQESEQVRWIEADAARHALQDGSRPVHLKLIVQARQGGIESGVPPTTTTAMRLDDAALTRGTGKRASQASVSSNGRDCGKTAS